MLYARITWKKIAIFMGVVALIGGMLSVTFHYKERMAPEYFSVDGLVAFAKIPVQAAVKRIEFLGETQAGRGLAALSFLGSGPMVASGALTQDAQADDVPVFVYHGITREADRFSMTPETFKDHMFSLAREGYTTITMDEFIEWAAGERPLPKKSILITFDDGRADSYYGADPVLAALGYNAVMFVATQASLRTDTSIYNYYLHRGLLSKMLASGRWEIGSHAVQEGGGAVPIDGAGTYDNFLSNKRWVPEEGRLETDREYRARLVRELAHSKEELEDALGIDVPSFAYPFGDYGQETSNNPGVSEREIAEIVSAEYKAAFRQVWPRTNLFTSNYQSNADPIQFRRIEPGTNWTGEDLLAVLAAAEAKPLPYEDSLDDDLGWKHSWGGVSVTDGSLVLAATPITTGALGFLDGTGAWRDYAYSIRARLGASGYVSLLSRFHDESNYVACVFGDDQVRITRKADGFETTMDKRVRDTSLAGRDLAFSMAVDGGSVRCYEDGDLAAEAEYAVSSDGGSGGIGVQVWHETPGQAELRVDELSVVPPEKVGLYPDMPDRGAYAFHGTAA